MGATCIFCRIIAGEIPSQEVARGEGWVAFRDVHPQAPTHVLVVPLRHIASLADLASTDAGLAGSMIMAAIAIARAEGILAEGFRLVWNCGERGGQTVPHLHLHLLGGRQLGWPPG
ncbi:MAG: histidine triad nucleotide-binding protein [Planctomycetes bacterium]|nr:histidine triad nucleotide-binding protein [Planctomycetota bacterium]